jgi:hypothetical protein
VNTHGKKDVRRAVDAPGQLGVGATAGVVDEGGLAAAARREVALYEVDRRVVVARDRQTTSKRASFIEPAKP